MFPLVNATPVTACAPPNSAANRLSTPQPLGAFTHTLQRVPAWHLHSAKWAIQIALWRRAHPVTGASWIALTGRFVADPDASGPLDDAPRRELGCEGREGSDR